MAPNIISWIREVWKESVCRGCRAPVARVQRAVIKQKENILPSIFLLGLLLLFLPTNIIIIMEKKYPKK